MTHNEQHDPPPHSANAGTAVDAVEKQKHLVQIIALQAADDTAVIRDHLRRAQGSRVVLVVPSACHALEREVGLRKLARYATLFDRNVALVTDNRQTRRLAQALGFSVYATTRKAQTARNWSKRWQPPLLRKGAGESGNRGTPLRRRTSALRPAGTSAPLHARTSAPDRSERLLTALLFATLIVLLGGGTFLVVPSAEVYLLPATVPVSVRVPIQADTSVERIDYKAGKIPARLVDIRLEGNAEAATTGRQDVANARAGGRIVLINRTAETVNVPKGTVVRDSSGTPVKFRTVEDVVIPPGYRQRAVAAIEAVDPGPRGNVPALVINRIEGPLALTVQVMNNQPTSGGDVKQVAMVTEADKKGLRQILLTRLRQEGTSALKENLEAGEFLPIDTISVTTDKEYFDHAVDDQTEKLHLTMGVRVRGLVVSDVAAASLARQALRAQVPAQHQLREETVEYSRGPVERLEKNVAYFTVEVSGKAVAKIDPASVRKAITGQSLPNARKRLVEQFPLASDPLIKITPTWLKHVPWLPFRVFVNIRDR